MADGMASPDATQRKRGRLKMLLVLLVCAAPVLASYFTYYVVRPEGRRNFGELIATQPLVPAGLVGRTASGAQLPLQQLQGQWLLVSVGDSACNAACEDHLYLQRQLRESLGREKDRVDWVWLLTDGQAPPARLAPAVHSATVLQVEPQALQQWLQPAPGQALADHLYLVDPMGRWMLRWPASLDRSSASKAKRDLERVLRAAASWDPPGR